MIAVLNPADQLLISTCHVIGSASNHRSELQSHVNVLLLFLVLGHETCKSKLVNVLVYTAYWLGLFLPFDLLLLLLSKHMPAALTGNAVFNSVNAELSSNVNSEGQVESDINCLHLSSGIGRNKRRRQTCSLVIRRRMFFCEVKQTSIY